MLPVGRHLVRVKNSQFTGSEGKTPQLSIYFEDENGQGAAWYSTLGCKADGGFSQQACDIACAGLKVLGWDAETRGYAFEELDGENSPIVGAEASVTVVEDNYDGKRKLKVKYIDDPNRRALQKMESGAARSFAERVRAGLRESGRPVSVIPASRSTSSSSLDAAIQREGADRLKEKLAEQKFDIPF